MAEYKKPAGKPSGARKKPFTRRPRGAYSRKRSCFFCVKKIKEIDYKDVNLLRRYITERGKILPRIVTSSCAKHQRMLSRSIKRARFMGILPYIER